MNATFLDLVIPRLIPYYARMFLNCTVITKKFVETFSDLGRSSVLSEELVLSLNAFVCLLYGDQDSKNVDDCR